MQDCDFPTMGEGVEKDANLCTIEGWSYMDRDDRAEVAPQTCNRVVDCIGSEECEMLREKFNRIGNAHFYWAVPRQVISASRSAPAEDPRHRPAEAPRHDPAEVPVRGPAEKPLPALAENPLPAPDEDHQTEQPANPFLKVRWPRGVWFLMGWPMPDELEGKPVVWDAARGEVRGCRACRAHKYVTRAGLCLDAHGKVTKLDEDLRKEEGEAAYPKWKKVHKKDFKPVTSRKRVREDDDTRDDSSDNKYVKRKEKERAKKRERLW
ncbi:unnamed protein product [Peniophora sp. CBMAI 1063]|nr:unnamed protein product [Peniophora sp. CBMAI 1063]